MPRLGSVAEKNLNLSNYIITGSASLLTAASSVLSDISLNSLAVSTIVGTPLILNSSPYIPFSNTYSYYLNGSTMIGVTNTIAQPGFIFNGPFTIEFWAYPTNNTNGGWIMNFGGGLYIAWASFEFMLIGSQFVVAMSSANSGYDIGGESTSLGGLGPAPNNTWSHVAVTRTGNTYRGYVNGIQGWSQTYSPYPYTPTGRGLNIGASYQNAWNVSANVYQFYTGYISNIRITNGLSLYNSNFSPPLSPLTAVVRI